MSAGGRRAICWRTLYNHSLDADERLAFLDEYQRRIGKAYPPLIDGRVLLRFPRLFVVAVRG